MHLFFDISKPEIPEYQLTKVQSFILRDTWVIRCLRCGYSFSIKSGQEITFYAIKDPGSIGYVLKCPNCQAGLRAFPPPPGCAYFLF